MFDIKRLNPQRVFPAIIRRIKEVSHLYAWKNSKLGKRNKEKLSSLKLKHKGEVLYLLANGPSINKTDLSLLKGKTVMCMNRFYIKFNDLNFGEVGICSI